jgi:hypothetical protein
MNAATGTRAVTFLFIFEIESSNTHSDESIAGSLKACSTASIEH